MPNIVGLDKHKQTSLQGISYKAKTNRKHRFENLFRLLNVELLTECWPGLNKKAASGVDKVTCEQYAKDLTDNIESLADKVKKKRYKAKLVRRQYIPKANGKLRPLGIPALEDKLPQSAAAKVLQAIYEQDFLINGFGYRPKVGASDAVKMLTVNLQFGSFGYIVEADIKGFFDNINHDWLLEMLRQRINDEAFLGLINKWLKAGILDTDGKVIHPLTGTPQGGIISPILANIHLRYVLDIWFERKVKTHCEGMVLLCRYADDFVCAFQYKADAEAFHRVLPKRLGKFGLTVAEDKTAIHRFSRFHPTFENRFAFLGFEFFWANDQKGVARVKKRTDRKKLKNAILNFKEWIKGCRNMELSAIMKILKSKLTGYYNYYGVICNYQSVCQFYHRSMDTLRKWLNRRSQRQSYNWEKFKQVLAHFNIPVPAITQSRQSSQNWIII
ncbi:group II intron reverse transcriptase/maturase [bacterium]|nr:group II intron reverse transcriptase/maturase [bacterium]